MRPGVDVCGMCMDNASAGDEAMPPPHCECGR
ncbi:hypothetical protein HaLaN_20521, partial [Haematococcus lacustris]